MPVDPFDFLMPSASSHTKSNVATGVAVKQDLALGYISFTDASSGLRSVFCICPSTDPQRNLREYSRPAAGALSQRTASQLRHRSSRRFCKYCPVPLLRNHGVPRKMLLRIIMLFQTDTTQTIDTAVSRSLLWKLVKRVILRVDYKIDAQNRCIVEWQ